MSEAKETFGPSLDLLCAACRSTDSFKRWKKLNWRPDSVIAKERSIDLRKCTTEDLVCRCPLCDYTDLLEHFDVLLADEGNIFCPICACEFKVEYVDLKRPLLGMMG